MHKIFDEMSLVLTMNFNFLFSPFLYFFILIQLSISSAFANVSGRVIFSGTIVPFPCDIPNDDDLDISLKSLTTQSQAIVPVDIHLSNCDVDIGLFNIVFQDKNINSLQDVFLSNKKLERIIEDGKTALSAKEINIHNETIELQVNSKQPIMTDSHYFKVMEIQYN